MGLLDALKEQCVAVGSTAVDKPGLLREIAQLACASPLLRDVNIDTVEQGLAAREELGSTGFTNGIAIPHCTLEGLGGFVVGLVTHPKGLQFDSLDKKPTHIFAFIVGPPSERNEHVRLLSGISRVLNDKATRDELLRATTPAVLHETFLRHAAGEVERGGDTVCSLFHVSVQRQELFDDILQVFSEMEGCSVSVIEAQDASSYLHRLPLFAGFWSDERHGFHRIIVAVVNRAFANETLRRINTVTGDLSRRRDIAVMVQDLIYCSGALEL